MAEIQPTNPEPVATPPGPEAAGTRPSQPRGPPLHQIYALPAPIKTFPLPTFYPNNPLSLFHVIYAWLGQVWSPPPAEPAVVHEGVWSPSTTSVHVTDGKSTRALWEQGFYGKGNLSRSEPNWLRREQVRRGLEEGHVSEIHTQQRREERMRAKWERARLEQEAIRQTRVDEARQARTHLEAKPNKKIVGEPPATAPVSPAKLLSLPNSLADLTALTSGEENPASTEAENGTPVEVNGSRLKLGLSTIRKSIETLSLDLPDSVVGHSATSSSSALLDLNESDSDPSKANGKFVNGKIQIPSDASSDTSDDSKSTKRRKSVRFSPTVESTTFGLSDPPSPNHTATLTPSDATSDTNGKIKSNGNGSILVAERNMPDALDEPVVIVDKEHLQLMPEEAFFLSFGLGALQVTDPSSGKSLTPMELFTLFRQYSYFPPRIGTGEPALQPDDSFLVHYSVYHHFRSMGWVPRGGIKFGVDWMLYTRGPVFDHAEFGLIVIPSFSHPLWKEAGKQSPQKSWQWLHGTIRVLSHVTKSLVLVYVDVPPPSKFEEALEKGFSEVFKLYKVREVMIKRWSSNRNRGG